MATDGEDAVKPCPSIRGLQCLALCNAEDSRLDLNTLTDLRALCVHFRAAGQVLLNAEPGGIENFIEVNPGLWDEYIYVLNIMQLDQRPLSMIGLQIPDVGGLTVGLMIPLLQPGVRHLALYCPHEVVTELNAVSILETLSAIAAITGARLNHAPSRPVVHLFSLFETRDFFCQIVAVSLRLEGPVVQLHDCSSFAIFCRECFSLVSNAAAPA